MVSLKVISNSPKEFGGESLAEINLLVVGQRGGVHAMTVILDCFIKID